MDQIVTKENLMLTVNYLPSEEEKFSLTQNLNVANIKNKMPEGTHCWIFLRDAQNQLVGGSKFYIFDHSIYLDELWVSEKYQGQGYGKKILEATEQEARKKGCQWVQLETYDFQNAKNFYEKYGYTEVNHYTLMGGKHLIYFLSKKL